LNDIREWMRRCREIEDTLPSGSDDIAVISVEDPMRGWCGGRMARVTRSNAARLIAEGSFRLATDSERAAAEATEEDARRKASFDSSTPVRAFRVAGRVVQLDPLPEKKRSR